MDDSSFNTYKVSIEKTINEPNEAFYGSFMNIQQEKMDCKVLSNFVKIISRYIETGISQITVN